MPFKGLQMNKHKFGLREIVILAVIIISAISVWPSIQVHTKKGEEQKTFLKENPKMGAKSINFGLDLAGGTSITLQIDQSGLKEGEEHLCFDRFWRADPARARTTGGTGLGLAIAKEDAQLHGGWLQAWGRPGKGAQFRLSLPRVAGTELRGSPLPLVPPEMALGGNLSVLSGQQVDLETGRGTSAGEEA